MAHPTADPPNPTTPWNSVRSVTGGKCRHRVAKWRASSGYTPSRRCQNEWVAKLSFLGAAAALFPVAVGGTVFALLAKLAGTPLTTARTGLICFLLAGTATAVAADLAGTARTPGYSPIAHTVAVFAIPLATLMAAKGPFESWLFTWWVLLLVGVLVVVGDLALCEHRSQRRSRPEMKELE